MIWCHNILESNQWQQNRHSLTFGSATIQWRNNGRDSISNHQPDDCLLNCLFKVQIKRNIMIHAIYIYIYICTQLCLASIEGKELPRSERSLGIFLLLLYIHTIYWWWDQYTSGVCKITFTFLFLFHFILARELYFYFFTYMHSINFLCLSIIKTYFLLFHY